MRPIERYFRARARQTGGYAVVWLTKIRRARSEDRRDECMRMAVAWASLAIHYARLAAPPEADKRSGDR